MTTIAFIGLGNMGLPMSRRLIGAGHRIVGYDVSEAARTGLARQGGHAAATLGEAVAEAECVITMLPTGRHVRAVYEDEGGILAAAPRDALLIDSSTIDIESARAVSAAAAAAGFAMVDAPVSGAVPAAEGGRLTFMVGGGAQAYARARPLLEPMGANFFHVGPAGSGQALKICNNMLAGMTMVALSEAIALGEKLGLDHQILYDVIVKSSGNCWALEKYCPVPGPVPASPANHGYAPGFALPMMLKDMRLAQQAAGSVQAATPLAGAAVALYQMAAAGGYADRDFSAIFQLIAGGGDRTHAGTTPASG
ncbi:3-hydroxyisobutyrate dehydrogenase [Methylobacterium aerolatum]|uniref:3-hydroxyisobutyrate dehydrogenase n=1 Tax=Methylobacterium aerolatum TaxID=418708 RepID=A0ABU0I7C2_9HYPH|nr:3-hydroxyisobutyrate dehydrogenase [Methylobacterium aerolatum]MDQ0449591.1 3-hydroxyisobutyrate dehydrogenase [Methylobacterium aerolatum]GJD36120.1 putative 3-hydroxyisobutyrate dehydrogenase [Methylobacterium aerolatum]